MSKKLFSKVFVFLLVVGLLFAAAPTGQAQAVSEIIYNAIPATLAPSYTSLAFQATQTYEFGDYVILGGTNRDLDTVSVTMVTWAYQTNYSGFEDPTGWDHPITLNIYNVIPGDPNTLGTLIGTKTVEFHLPWRPEPDTVNCTENRWYDAATATCNNGFAFNITFDLSDLDITLPSAIVLGIAFNTQTYGANPIGLSGPYNELNVSVSGEQSVGTDGNTDRVFWNTTYGPFYDDGGAAGVGIFREDTSWGIYGTVPFQITVAVEDLQPFKLYLPLILR